MIDRNVYGTVETNGLLDAKSWHERWADADTVDWTDPELGRIVRLRLLSDPGFPFWDVSYCQGELKDGTPVRVQVPFSQLPKRGIKAEIVKWGRRDGVFAKGLGLLDDGVISKLC